MNEVEAQGDLEAAIKRVGQAKEKAAKAKHGTKAMEEGSGREYIDTKVDVGLTADDVGATAKKGNAKRGKNDARARDAAGNLIKSGGENQIDELKSLSSAYLVIDTVATMKKIKTLRRKLFWKRHCRSPRLLLTLLSLI